jgi:hypothetical protein
MEDCRWAVLEINCGVVKQQSQKAMHQSSILHRTSVAISKDLVK